jgi:hypothetical protein
MNMKSIYLALIIIIISGFLLLSGHEPVSNEYTEYRVIEACGSNKGIPKIQEFVSAMMKDGWKPVGGINLYQNYDVCYYQAMAR